MLSFTTTGGTLAASRPALPRQRRARYLYPVRLSALLALAGACLALASLQWHLVGLALCHGGALAALVLGIVAAMTRQCGALTGLLPAVLLSSLAALEPWLPAVLLNLLQALTL
ncbi:hypothetical protein [Alcanivorax quisquiliarum]|uniref:Uncharacterized protein n=1 Tax=Alcanivorax quisquiliarum TaxID=2933565 RepID=A0ABT0E9G6_9GAMM|nr:hypothetical protein [Alcanivorax quisquiliarum]MCK0538383.1 hypothetical protein [Alcanivorax quisquiliarum]